MMRKPLFVWMLFLLPAVVARAGEAEGEGAVARGALEVFQETSVQGLLTDSLLPTERRLSGLFGSADSVLEVGRSVTLVSPEAMKQFGLRGWDDLPRVGAGTQRTNFFGLAGSPVLRGAVAGTTYRGMKRAFNRNEMPLSLGSFEALEIVRGVAPAHFGPMKVGGFVNLLPKSPYFDEYRGEVRIEVGSWDHYQAQVDVGGPTLAWGEVPAAYRVSLTGQRAGSYYQGVRDDFLSAYMALAAQPRPHVDFFTAAEVFEHRSNENTGWNRPTQNLVSHGRYVIGEPVLVTSPEFGGNADRRATEFPFTTAMNPGIYALAVPGDVARARIPAHLLAQMRNMNDAADRRVVYDASGTDIFGNPLPDGLRQTLAQGQATPQDVYVYTPGYFAAGGEALTDPISGRQVLADPNDFANAVNVLWFGDVVYRGNPVRLFTLKNLAEYVQTQKQSSYGYASETRQLVLASQLQVEERELFEQSVWTWGGELRFTSARIREDFFAEPFGRRDLTRPGISPNSVIAAGSQRGPDGLNYWSPAQGANTASDLYQAGLFSIVETEWSERLRTTIGGRIERAQFDISMPRGVERASPDLVSLLEQGSGGKTLVNASFSPVYRLTDGLNLYGAYQIGTALDATGGGAISGADNFARAELLEAGIKMSGLEGQLFATLAVYQWEQSRFNVRDVSAEPLRGRGVETELSWRASPGLTIVGAYTLQEVRRLTPLGFRTDVLGEEGFALQGGILNPGGPEVPGGNPRLVYPGSPAQVLQLMAVYQWENGLGMAGGPIYQDSFWLNFDRTIKLPPALIWNMNLFYRQPRYEVMLAIENLTSEDYFLGADPVFAANTLVTKAAPVSARLTFSYRW